MNSQTCLVHHSIRQITYIALQFDKVQRNAADHQHTHCLYLHGVEVSLPIQVKNVTKNLRPVVAINIRNIIDEMMRTGIWVRRQPAMYETR
jgi:hypothetical protein